jgi:hypothetical protein
MSNLHRTLRNVYLRESLDDAYSMIASELNDNARQMGINLPNAVVVNTNRVLKSINDIKDMSEGKVQWLDLVLVGLIGLDIKCQTG